jgi:hypothetical protein
MPEPINSASQLATRGPLFAATQAIQARLAMAFPPDRFQHGMLPAVPTRDIWLKLVRRTPYVGLTWLAAPLDAASGRAPQMKSTWRVLLVNSHTDVEARFFGDRIAPGQFGLVQVAIAALHGFTAPATDAVADIGTLAVTDVQALSADWSDAAEAIAGLTVESSFHLTDSAAGLDELLRLRGNWQFQGATDLAAPAETDLGVP